MEKSADGASYWGKLSLTRTGKLAGVDEKMDEVHTEKPIRSCKRLRTVTKINLPAGPKTPNLVHYLHLHCDF